MFSIKKNIAVRIEGSRVKLSQPNVVNNGYSYL